MAKTLCIIGMALSALVFLVFLLDISFAIPFLRYSIMMDVVFLAVSALLAWMSWNVYREQS